MIKEIFNPDFTLLISRFAKVPTYNQVENIDLFCEHQKLLYSAEDIMSQPSDEYATLHHLFYKISVG